MKTKQKLAVLFIVIMTALLSSCEKHYPDATHLPVNTVMSTDTVSLTIGGWSGDHIGERKWHLLPGTPIRVTSTSTTKVEVNGELFTMVEGDVINLKSSL